MNKYLPEYITSETKSTNDNKHISWQRDKKYMEQVISTIQKDSSGEDP